MFAYAQYDSENKSAQFTAPLARSFYLSASPRAHLHVAGILRFLSFDISQPSFRAPIILFFVSYFCLYGTFNYISHHKLDPHNTPLSPVFFSSGLISALLVLSTFYLFRKVSPHSLRDPACQP